MIELLLQAERSLSIGMLDDAERLYRRAAEQDPRNAIAVVGLARIAIERGDERGAYQEALRALAIDPENAAAVRLETRLAEVFATRGEPIERPRQAIRAAERVERRVAAEAQGRSVVAPPPAPGRPVYAPPAGSRFESAVKDESGVKDGSAVMDRSAGHSSPPDRRRRRGILDRLLGR